MSRIVVSRKSRLQWTPKRKANLLSACWTRESLFSPSGIFRKVSIILLFAIWDARSYFTHAHASMRDAKKTCSCLLLSSHAISFCLREREWSMDASLKDEFMMIRLFKENHESFIQLKTYPSVWGEELSFDYDMDELSEGTPLPPCYCGAPSCNGKLGKTSEFRIFVSFLQN